MERELRKLKRMGGDDSGVVSSADRLGDYVGVAKGEIARLDYIITEFLQALRPSPPKKQFVSLNTVVEETLTLLRPELENRGLLVESSLSESLPPVQLDPGQMKQVLVNLLKNAMQATNKGGSITLSSGFTPDAVWLSVADTGSGIPPELLNQIFQPFYTTKQKGTGLGLMIVQRIVRDHDGRIELESKPGRGTTFKIWLPRHGPRLLPLPAGD
jgi:signal transduction histidine kinase